METIGTFSDLTIVWGHTKIMHSLHGCLLTLKHVVFFLFLEQKNEMCVSVPIVNKYFL
jgi:hypothetical protein